MSSELVPVNPSGECPCKYRKNGVGAFVRTNTLTAADLGHPNPLYEGRGPEVADAIAHQPSGQSICGGPDGAIGCRVEPPPPTTQPTGSSSTWAIVLAVIVAMALALYFVARRRG